MEHETSLNHETPPIANVLLADSAFNGWIKLNGIPQEIEDCDCWLLRKDGVIFLSPQGDFVGLNEYEFYMPIRKPTILPEGF
jgi:hypothetical protein